MPGPRFEEGHITKDENERRSTGMIHRPGSDVHMKMGNAPASWWAAQSALAESEYKSSGQAKKDEEARRKDAPKRFAEVKERQADAGGEEAERRKRISGYAKEYQHWKGERMEPGKKTAAKRRGAR